MNKQILTLRDKLESFETKSTDNEGTIDELLNRIKTLEKENEYLKNERNNHLKIIELLSNQENKKQLEEEPSIPKTKGKRNNQPNVISQNNSHQNKYEQLNVVSNINHNTNSKPNVVPGNRSFSSATKYGKKVMLVGDSHLKRIKRKLFNDSIENEKCYIKSYSGANIKELNHFIELPLAEEKPDITVIHIGSNEVDNRNCETLDIKETAQRIINIGRKCKDSGVSEVVISSILVKRNFKITKTIRKINDELRELCLMNNFNFICNDEISSRFLSRDGIHLVEEGTYILAGNFVNFLNRFLLPRDFNVDFNVNKKISSNVNTVNNVINVNSS